MAARTTGYRWHLRRLMAGKEMYATTQLGPLLAERGITLSREQVYRLVTGVPERLSLATLAALCDILGCQPGDLIEVAASTPAVSKPKPAAAARRPRPVRARVVPGPGSR
jgi:DNA-binding Xre family transcriptional regulator